MNDRALGIIRQALELLDRSDRIRLAAIAALSTVAAVLEVAGIGSIVPFISAVATAGDVSAMPWLDHVRARLGVEGDRALISALGVAVVALMTARNAFFAFSAWLVSWYSSTCRRNLSARLLEGYLAQPFDYFLTHNTNELRRNVFQETGHVVDGVLLPGVQILSSAVVAAAIVSLLLVADPRAALTASGVLGIAYLLTYRLTAPRLDRFGKEAQQCRQRAFRLASEAFGGIKDLKLLGREHAFVAEYRLHAARLSDIEQRRSAIALIPRYAIETVAIACVVLFVLHLARDGGALRLLFPMLALYLLAGYRLLPALQQIYSGLTQLRYARAALAAVHRDLEQCRGGVQRAGDGGNAGPALSFRRTIRIRAQRFCYPGASAAALRDIDVEIQRNTAVAFVGATGAGKTTLVDLLMGLLEPTAGEVLVDDTPLDESNRGRWQRSIGYVPQHIWLADDTVAANIAFAVPAPLVDRDAVRRAAETASLHEFIRDELPAGYDTVIGERGIRLSGGQRQRVGIARALYHQPSLLVFDEATSALDGATERTIIDAIDRLSRSITIVLIAHRLNTVVNCDRIHVLEKGTIVDAGSYAQLVRDSVAFRRLGQ